jgi:DNA gyrase subunit B
LRGKILNTYVEDLNVKKNGNGDSSEQQRTKALSKMISSNEIVTLINALGTRSKSTRNRFKRSKVWKNYYYDGC